MRPWVEVEELPTQVLAPRAKGRPPMTGAIAVGAVAVLLAAGFGLLGGRPAGTPGSTPSASRVAALSSLAPSAAEPLPVPLVTPWTDCAEQPGDPARAVLEVDGEQTPGHVEPLDFTMFRTFNPDPSFDAGELPAVAEVPMDAVTEIWIDGGACAVAWTIDLAGNEVPGGFRTLESVGNEHRDPAVSAQNRFQVFVAPLAGDHELRAILVFDESVVRVTWPIHVPALEAPSGTLTSKRGEIPTVIGCDMTERLVNDVEVPLGQCDLDVPDNPARRVEVAPGEVLEFTIDGWPRGDASVQCGLLIQRRFFPRTAPPCVRDLDPLFAGARFPAPEEAGSWALAISTCTERSRVAGNGSDVLCGTWYARVLVRD